MNVGINAYLCSSDANYRRTGVHRYIHELVSALSRLDDPPAITAFVQASFADESWTGVALRPASVPLARAPARIAFEATGLPIIVRRSGVDLFHGPVNTIPHGLGIPTVVTVHDLAFLMYPDQVTKRRYHYLKTMIGSSVRRADIVLTPSEATRKDVMDRFALPGDKVRVTPLGVDGRYATESRVDIKQRYGLNRPFILYVGTIEPRKNLARLISASAQIQKSDEHDLVLAGPDGWLMDDVEQAIAGYGHPDRLKRIGFVNDDVLSSLYKSAAIVAIPSIYEGFGLPILEAMSAGAAVLTSNVSSMPEVAGDAAELIDPFSTEAIASGLERLLRDDGRRDELRRLGLERSTQFTWKRTAELTRDVYVEMLS